METKNTDPRKNDVAEVKDAEVLGRLSEILNTESNVDEILADFKSEANTEDDAEQDSQAVLEDEQKKTNSKKNIKSVVWCESPPQGKSLEECLSDSSMHRVAQIETFVLDLSEDKDLQSYNDFLTAHTKGDSNRLVTAEERRWSDIDGTWKVFIQLTTFEFKQLK